MKKILFNTFLIVLQLSLGIQCLNAQDIAKDEINFLQVKDGISKRPISEIIQDNQGFIWIGTQGDGLYRFDGIHTKNYVYDIANQNTIDSNFIYCVFFDSNNRLWVGTKRGLNVYNRDLDRFERVSLTDVKGIDGSLDVKCMIEDEYENLILGTYGKGIFKLSTSTMKVTKVKIGAIRESDFIVHEFAKNEQDEIYLSSRIGLFKLNKKKDSLYRQKFYYQKKYKTLDFVTRSLLFDSNNNLWIGTDENGLLKKDSGDSLTTFSITKKKILSILSKDDVFLLGTENDGLLVIDKNGLPLNRYVNNYEIQKGINSNSIWELFEDKEGRIWIGYFDKGTGVYDPRASKFKSLTANKNTDQSLQGKSVSAIQQDANNNLWIGLDGGIDIYNPKTRRFEHINDKPQSKYKGLTSSAILNVFIDSNNNLWAGTWDSGIFYLENGSNAFKNFNTLTTNNQLTTDAIFDFAEDSNGNIFMASFIKGLHYYSSKDQKIYHCNTEPFTELNLDNQDVRVVFADSKDYIWVGTQNDIYKIKLDTNNEFEVERITDKIPDKYRNRPGGTHILSFFESKDGTIWIGTNGSGLLSYNSLQKKFEDPIEIQGFKESVVNGILEVDEEILLIAGSLGITRIDLKEKSAYSLNKDDGLLSTNFNNGTIFKGSDGSVYIGSFEGLNYFNPQTIKFNKVVPKTYFTSLKIFNKEITPIQSNSTLTKEISQTKNITLSPKQSVFTIDYSAINFTRAETTNYAYKLEGFDENWNYVGHTKNASYTNLKPGTYKFQVKASNNDGAWNEMPTNLGITVLSPWWLKWWAVMLYIIFAILVLWFFIQSRISSVRKDTERKYEIKLLKQIQLEEGRQLEKDRVAKELHDGVLGSVFGIRLGLENLDKLPIEHQKGERLDYVEKLSKLEGNIRTISHGLSPNISISGLAFTKIVEKLLEEQCSKHDLKYEIENDQDITWHKIDYKIKFNCYRIIQESILNIIKHSKAKKIEINFIKHGNKLQLRIIDDGIGFSKRKTKLGIGLKNIRSRIKQLKGEVSFENNKSKGAMVKAEIPLY